MIRRVGVGGLTLLLGSSALALGVLSITGPLADDWNWDEEMASFSPVELARPEVRLPAIVAENNLSLAGIGLARPAAFRINPPMVEAAELDDARLRPVAVDAPELTLTGIAPTEAGALTSVAQLSIQAPGSAVDARDSEIRLAQLGSHEAGLPDVPVTDAGALAAVVGIAIQPPDARPLEREIEAGFVAIELEPKYVELAPVRPPAPQGLLCSGTCVAAPELATCDKVGGGAT